MNRGDFDLDGSKAGLKFGEFENLDQNIKIKLIKMISRIMERAYRRGVQQTLHMRDRNTIDDWILEDPHNYRYGKSLNISIGLDGFTNTSIKRLMIEENLEVLGFHGMD